MSILDWVREDLRDFAGYSSARKEAAGGSVLLNANESPWPTAGDGMGLNRYPQPQPDALVQALAALYATQPERVLVGRGSDEAIDLLVRALCRAGRDAVLISPPTFGMYAVSARIQDAAIVRVPLRVDDGFALDVDAVLQGLTPEVRIVFVCSPNNPSGNRVPTAQLARLAEELRGRALMVIDEAYAEFADEAPGVALAHRHPHVAVLRTLSKAYALAGARIGTLIADPALIRVLRSLMAPYPLPTPSVQLALAALAPQSLALARSRVGLIIEERARIARLLAAHPEVFQVYPSEANFVLLRVRDAARIMRHAGDAGIVLRRPDTTALPGEFVRVSIGAPDENDRLLRCLAGLPHIAEAAA